MDGQIQASARIKEIEITRLVGGGGEQVFQYFWIDTDNKPNPQFERIPSQAGLEENKSEFVNFVLSVNPHFLGCICQFLFFE